MTQTLKLLRQKGALERLEAQLKSGVKNEKKTNISVPLTNTDIIRINKEITTLNGRRVSNE